MKGCVGCHSKQGETTSGVNVGPDLTVRSAVCEVCGLAARAATRREGMSAEAYVRESLHTPSAFVVPGYGGTARMPDLRLSEAEIDALAAFLLAPEGP